MKVNVLGTEYEIFFEEKGKVIEGQKQDDEEHDGYIDFTTKRIYITDMSDYYWENIEIHKNRTLRHELVHAFLFESGLDHSSGWARDEEIVDWIALQVPKMAHLFMDLEIL